MKVFIYYNIFHIPLELCSNGDEPEIESIGEVHYQQIIHKKYPYHFRQTG